MVISPQVDPSPWYLTVESSSSPSRFALSQSSCLPAMRDSMLFYTRALARGWGGGKRPCASNQTALHVDPTQDWRRLWGESGRSDFLKIDRHNTAEDLLFNTLLSWSKSPGVWFNRWWINKWIDGWMMSSSWRLGGCLMFKVLIKHAGEGVEAGSG